MSDDRTMGPFVDADRPIRSTPRTIVAIVGALVVGACSYALLRAQVEQNTKEIGAHARKLESIDEKLDAQRGLLMEIRADQKAAAAAARSGRE